MLLRWCILTLSLLAPDEGSTVDSQGIPPPIDSVIATDPQLILSSNLPAILDFIGDFNRLIGSSTFPISKLATYFYDLVYFKKYLESLDESSRRKHDIIFILGRNIISLRKKILSLDFFENYLDSGNPGFDIICTFLTGNHACQNNEESSVENLDHDSFENILMVISRFEYTKSAEDLNDASYPQNKERCGRILSNLKGFDEENVEQFLDENSNYRVSIDLMASPESVQSVITIDFMRQRGPNLLPILSYNSIFNIIKSFSSQHLLAPFYEIFDEEYLSEVSSNICSLLLSFPKFISSDITLDPNCLLQAMKYEDATKLNPFFYNDIPLFWFDEISIAALEIISEKSTEYIQQYVRPRVFRHLFSQSTDVCIEYDLESILHLPPFALSRMNPKCFGSMNGVSSVDWSHIIEHLPAKILSHYNGNLEDSVASSLTPEIFSHFADKTDGVYTCRAAQFFPHVSKEALLQISLKCLKGHLARPGGPKFGHHWSWITEHFDFETLGFSMKSPSDISRIDKGEFMHFSDSLLEETLKTILQDKETEIKMRNIFGKEIKNELPKNVLPLLYIISNSVERNISSAIHYLEHLRTIIAENNKSGLFWDKEKIPLNLLFAREMSDILSFCAAVNAEDILGNEEQVILDSFALSTLGSFFNFVPDNFLATLQYPLPGCLLKVIQPSHFNNIGADLSEEYLLCQDMNFSLVPPEAIVNISDRCLIDYLQQPEHIFGQNLQVMIEANIFDRIQPDFIDQFFSTLDLSDFEFLKRSYLIEKCPVWYSESVQSAIMNNISTEMPLEIEIWNIFLLLLSMRIPCAVNFAAQIVKHFNENPAHREAYLNNDAEFYVVNYSFLPLTDISEVLNQMENGYEVESRSPPVIPLLIKDGISFDPDEAYKFIVSDPDAVIDSRSMMRTDGYQDAGAVMIMWLDQMFNKIILHSEDGLPLISAKRGYKFPFLVDPEYGTVLGVLFAKALSRKLIPPCYLEPLFWRAVIDFDLDPTSLREYFDDIYREEIEKLRSNVPADEIEWFDVIPLESIVPRSFSKNYPYLAMDTRKIFMDAPEHGIVNYSEYCDKVVSLAFDLFFSCLENFRIQFSKLFDLGVPRCIVNRVIFKKLSKQPYARVDLTIPSFEFHKSIGEAQVGSLVLNETIKMNTLIFQFYYLLNDRQQPRFIQNMTASSSINLSFVDLTFDISADHLGVIKVFDPEVAFLHRTRLSQKEAIEYLSEIYPLEYVKKELVENSYDRTPLSSKIRAISSQINKDSTENCIRNIKSNIESILLKLNIDENGVEDLKSLFYRILSNAVETQKKDYLDELSDALDEIIGKVVNVDEASFEKELDNIFKQVLILRTIFSIHYSKDAMDKLVDRAFEPILPQNEFERLVEKISEFIYGNTHEIRRDLFECEIDGEIMRGFRPAFTAACFRTMHLKAQPAYAVLLSLAQQLNEDPHKMDDGFGRAQRL